MRKMVTIVILFSLVLVGCSNNIVESTNTAEGMDIIMETGGTTESTIEDFDIDMEEDSVDIGEEDSNIISDVSVSKRFETDDQWHYLEEDKIVDGTYIEDDKITNFKHYKVGDGYDGMTYYIEYIDRDNMYITFENSEGANAKQLTVSVYDCVTPLDWNTESVDYFIESGETVTKQYRIDNRIKEDRPIEFGIFIHDAGWKYKDYQGRYRADIFERGEDYNLDIIYYGYDNTISYKYDPMSFNDESFKGNDNLPDGIVSFRFE